MFFVYLEFLIYYIIYRVTNLINNKYYIGMHRTNDLKNGYMGSGKLIRAAIKKYGIENFKKEVLHHFDNEEEMKNKEKELVVLEEQSYNLCPGGKGGFGYINKNDLNFTYEKNKRITKGWQVTKEQLQTNGRNSYKKQKDKYGENFLIERCSKYLHLVNTEEAIKKRKETYKKIGFQQGEKNSQFGTFWITDGKTNKKWKDSLGNLPDGFYKGKI